MRDIRIDFENQLGYFTLSSNPVNKTQAISERLNVDFDEQGNPVGIEVIGPIPGIILAQPEGEISLNGAAGISPASAWRMCSIHGEIALNGKCPTHKTDECLGIYYRSRKHGSA